jgi:hypothetical protein
MFVSKEEQKEDNPLALYFCVKTKGRLVKGQRVWEFSDGFYLGEDVSRIGTYKIVKGDRINFEQYADVLVRSDNIMDTDAAGRSEYGNQ